MAVFLPIDLEESTVGDDSAFCPVSSLSSTSSVSVVSIRIVANAATGAGAL